MALKRKAFVVGMMRSQDSLGAAVYRDIRRRVAPIPKLGDLLSSPGVRRTAQGLFIDLNRGRGLHEALSMVDSHFVSPAQSKRLAKERVAIVRQLASLGYKVAVPRFNFSEEHILDQVKGHARIFHAREPITGKMGDTVEVSQHATIWLRDLWSKVDGKRVKKEFSKNPSSFGEGGAVIPIGNKGFLVAGALRNTPMVKKLGSQGYRIYFLNQGFKFKPKLTKLYKTNTFLEIDHIDLFVGVTKSIMLVDQDYYKQNQGILRSAARDNKLNVLLIPQEEAKYSPANFLQLEANKVLVDSRAKKTIQLLQQHGIEAIPTAMPITANWAFSGGVRCFVNEL